ncbi:unnamed protein product [Bubo scandiacus]
MQIHQKRFLPQGSEQSRLRQESNMMRLFVLLATLYSGASSSVVLQKMYGRITSPNFPNVYPNHKERIWNITVPKGYSVRIYFTHFNLELSYLCEYDYVKLSSGGRTLATLCGKDSTDTEEAPGNKTYISVDNNLMISMSANSCLMVNPSAIITVTTTWGATIAAVGLATHCMETRGRAQPTVRVRFVLKELEKRPAPAVAHLIPHSAPAAQYPGGRGFQITLEFTESLSVETHPGVLCPCEVLKVCRVPVLKLHHTVTPHQCRRGTAGRQFRKIL